MRLVTIVILFFFPLYCSSREREKNVELINAYVRKVDGQVSQAFSIRKKIKAVPVTENWSYTLDKDLVSSISISYWLDSTNLYEESYYVKDNNVVFARESEIYYYPIVKEENAIEWRVKMYFDKGKLIDISSLGHGKTEDDTWDPEKEVPENFKKRKQELKHYLEAQAKGKHKAGHK